MAVRYSIRQGVITMEFVGVYEPRDVVARLGAFRGQAMGIDAQVFRTTDEALTWLNGTSVSPG